MIGDHRTTGPAHFARVQRSAIVNIRRVKAIHPWFNGHHVVALEASNYG